MNALAGPFETLEEMQAAASRIVPGAVIVRQNAHSGEVKNAQSQTVGAWSAAPYQFTRRVAFTALVGPCATFEELQEAAQRELPGSRLAPPDPKAEDKHAGDVKDSLGNTIGTWTER